MNPLNNPPMFDSDQRRERDHGLEAMILSLQRSVGALTDTVTCMSYEHGRLQQEVARLQASQTFRPAPRQPVYNDLPRRPFPPDSSPPFSHEGAPEPAARPYAMFGPAHQIRRQDPPDAFVYPGSKSLSPFEMSSAPRPPYAGGPFVGQQPDRPWAPSVPRGYPARRAAPRPRAFSDPMKVQSGLPPSYDRPAPWGRPFHASPNASEAANARFKAMDRAWQEYQRQETSPQAEERQYRASFEQNQSRPDVTPLTATPPTETTPPGIMRQEPSIERNRAPRPEQLRQMKDLMKQMYKTATGQDLALAEDLETQQNTARQSATPAEPSQSSPRGSEERLGAEPPGNSHSARRVAGELSPKDQSRTMQQQPWKLDCMPPLRHHMSEVEEHIKAANENSVATSDLSAAHTTVGRPSLLHHDSDIDRRIKARNGAKVIRADQVGMLSAVGLGPACRSALQGADDLESGLTHAALSREQLEAAQGDHAEASSDGFVALDESTGSEEEFDA